MCAVPPAVALFLVPAGAIKALFLEVPIILVWPPELPTSGAFPEAIMLVKLVLPFLLSWLSIPFR